MTTLTIDQSGNLIITLTEDGKQFLAEKSETDQNDDQLFCDLMETPICNGYHWVQPEEIGALTSSLLIADGIIDSGDPLEINVWYYNYYAIKSYLADLKEQGYVIWNKA